MRKILQVTGITISKFMPQNKAYKFCHIFLIVLNYAYYKNLILCGHFDTHIVDIKLFWKKNCRFLTKIQFEKGGVITNREGVKKKLFQFWKDNSPKLNHERNK